MIMRYVTSAHKHAVAESGRTDEVTILELFTNLQNVRIYNIGIHCILLVNQLQLSRYGNATQV